MPPRPVRFLLLHAWGVGGTIRTTFTTAAHLSATHDVEVVSVLRGEVEPGIAVPAGVRLRPLHDRTRRRPTPRNGLALLLASVPSVLWHEQDWAYQRMSLWTDVLLLRWQLAAAPAAVRPYSSQQVGRRWDELLAGSTPEEPTGKVSSPASAGSPVQHLRACATLRTRASPAIREVRSGGVGQTPDSWWETAWKRRFLPPIHLRFAD